MRVRRSIAAVVVTLIWAWGSPALSATATPPNQCSADNLNGDARLGPRDLPSTGPVGLELTRYNRLAGLSPNDFIATYWDPTAFGGQGGWRYPPFNGFLVGPNGQPIEAPIPLRIGQQVDRYGSEFGAFLAPFGILYSQRAIPPQSLDNTTTPATCNYRAYKVLKEFRVDGGPIAPAFGQPGKGVQYMLQGSLVPGAPAQLNVLWLVDNGYLQRLN